MNADPRLVHKCKFYRHPTLKKKVQGMPFCRYEVHEECARCHKNHVHTFKTPHDAEEYIADNPMPPMPTFPK